MDLLIAISGCSGGTEGPQGVYKCLKKNYENENLKILPFDTLPDVIQANADKVSDFVTSSLDTYQNIYIMGHSMGGAVAALSALQANKKTAGAVKGIVLLDTQTDGMNALKDLNIPVLFYQGKEDEYFPTWQIESLYNTYEGPKKMVELEELNHDLGRVVNEVPEPKTKEFTNDLAQDLFAEMSEFFFQKELGTEKKENSITSKTITYTPHKKTLMEHLFGLIKM